MSGCTESHSRHYCRVCKSKDSDHFSRHCGGGGGSSGGGRGGGSSGGGGGSSGGGGGSSGGGGGTSGGGGGDGSSGGGGGIDSNDSKATTLSTKSISSHQHTTEPPRCVHFSHRLGHIPSLHARRQDSIVQRLKKRTAATKTEFVAVVGGATTLATILHEMQPTSKIGLMVSGNGGRPGGACGGDTGHIEKLHSGHSTQEEDVISCWFLTECPEGGDKSQYDALFHSTIHGQWGLVDRTGRSEDPVTIQGVDYVHSSQPDDHAEAWRVRQCLVSRKIYIQQQRQYSYDTAGTKVPCELVFVVGPNAGASQRPTGTTARTRSLLASSKREYVFFKESVKCAVRAGLDAMIDGGCDIALVAMVSCGIYAGPHRERISREFVGMVDELLDEEVGLVKDSEHSTSKSEKMMWKKLLRGDCFDRVFIPLLCTCGERSQCQSCQKSMKSMCETTDSGQRCVKRDTVAVERGSDGGDGSSQESDESHTRQYSSM